MFKEGDLVEHYLFGVGGVVINVNKCHSISHNNHSLTAVKVYWPTYGLLVHDARDLEKLKSKEPKSNKVYKAGDLF